MTRSIFDPTSGQTEHSGNRFTGPDADNISHMPSEIVDGKVSEEEVAEQEERNRAKSEEGPKAM